MKTITRRDFFRAIGLAIGSVALAEAFKGHGDGITLYDPTVGPHTFLQDAANMLKGGPGRYRVNHAVMSIGDTVIDMN